MVQKILILGAGPAGLALAVKLLRRPDLKAEIIVIEQNQAVGGLTASFEYEGLYFDYGSHRLHPATAPEILRDVRALLGPDLLDRPRNGRIRLLGRFVKFPLNPLDLALHLPPSFLAGVGRDALGKLFRPKGKVHSSFAEVLLDGLGRTICHTFYFPYARKLWGLVPEEIAPVQAYKRVSANSIGKMMRKALAIVPGLKPEGAGRFFYPRKGYGQISRALAQEVERLGGQIRLSTRMQELRLQHGRPASVIVGPGSAEAPRGSVSRALPSEEIASDFVFSTIPVTVLVSRLRPQPPSAIEHACQQSRYRGMILCYLVLATNQFTPYDAHYLPESETIISRLSEPKNYSASQEPHGITGVCAEIPCAVGSDVWNTSDQDLCARVVTELARVELPIQSPMKAMFVRRLPHVYPIYDQGFDRRFRVVDDYLGQIPGLISLGRQGLFAHDNTHHTMEMAYRASACLEPDLTWNAEMWRTYRAEFETHVVED